MSKSSKGKKAVNEVIAIYEQNGWLCWKPGNKAIWLAGGKCISMSQDIFGCYDFIAKKKHRPFHLVQVTTITPTSGNAYDRMKKIDKLDIDDRYSESIVIGRMRGKKWKVWKKSKDGWILCGNTIADLTA